MEKSPPDAGVGFEKCDSPDVPGIGDFAAPAPAPPNKFSPKSPELAGCDDPGGALVVALDPNSPAPSPPPVLTGCDELGAPPVPAPAPPRLPNRPPVGALVDAGAAFPNSGLNPVPELAGVLPNKDPLDAGWLLPPPSPPKSDMADDVCCVELGGAACPGCLVSSVAVALFSSEQLGELP